MDMVQKGQDHRVKIVTAFTEFRPPFDFESSIDTLLRLTAPKYLRGLDRILLRDGAGLPRRQIVEERKIGKSLGYYHKPTVQRRGWIELYVDRIVDGYSPILMRMRWFRERTLGATLFHELGHHINAQVKPQFGDAERIAEEWKRQLFREYTPRRFSHLMFLRPQRPPVSWLFRATVLTIRWLAARLK